MVKEVNGMIAALVRIFCKDNLRDCRHVFEIRLPRLMDDVADGDQFAQAREHDLVYLHRSLGAAENEDGRYVRFKAEILPRAFGLYAHEPVRAMFCWAFFGKYSAELSNEIAIFFANFAA